MSLFCHFVLGTRPEIIKLAPLIDKWIQTGNACKIIHSGQHYDFVMDKVFFRDLGLAPPDETLNVGSLPPVNQTASILAGVARVLDRDKAALVVVQGDTNTTLGGALAAAKRPQTTLAHVEAGCRSFNRSMPEEVNRIVTDHVSHLRFAATRHDLENLHNEGLSDGSFVVGSTGIESCLRNAPLAAKNSNVMAALSLKRRDFALATVHRDENTTDKNRLSHITEALDKISEDLPVVFPVHPRTTEAMKGFGLDWPRNVLRTNPLGYFDFLALLVNAKLVLTDSGGVQEEAAVLGTRCFTLRQETEWLFTVEAGVNTLVGVSGDRIVDAVRDFLRWDPPPKALLPQWVEGQSPSQLIANHLLGLSE